MGLGLRFGVGPLRVYVPLTGGSRRRRRGSSTSRTRKPALRGVSSRTASPEAVRKPAFHGTARLPDGSIYQCHHSHRTEQAAAECGAKYIRANFPETHSSASRQRAASVPPQNAEPEVSRPAQWWPRAGWGTVRGYRFVNSGNGRADIAFYFVPDDGSQPQLIELTNTVPLREIGEYARGVKQGDNFTIKVSAEAMADVARTFQKINQMEFPKRQAMFAKRNDLDGDAGWAWTPDYTLKPVAPGLLS